MADGVDIDQNVTQTKDGDYGGDDDLYDDVVAGPSSEPHERNDNENGSIPPTERPDGNDANGSYSHMGNTFAPNHPGRRHQLYVGNLTWSTTDQDITDAVNSVGVNDLDEVKFLDNRASGQSEGFCVITLGSESGMRMCLERLPKNDLHGQKPIVTLPTKAALAQFESQQKTRPIPPTTNTSRGGQPPMQPGGGPMQGNFPKQPMMGERPMGPQGQGQQGMRYHPLLDALKPQSIPPANQFPEQPIHSQMSKAEFEKIMTRLSDDIETLVQLQKNLVQLQKNLVQLKKNLVTAISLIEQSEFAHDERFEILRSSLQDTLKGPPQGHPHGHPNSGGMNQPPQNMQHGDLPHWLQNLPDCLKQSICGIWVIGHILIFIISGFLLFGIVVNNSSLFNAVVSVAFFLLHTQSFVLLAIVCVFVPTEVDCLQLLRFCTDVNSLLVDV